MKLNSGIYCWTNKVNGKIYIGQSRRLNSRKSKFLRFNEYRYGGDFINNARKKYNDISYWEYEVLEYCSSDELNDKEKYYISFYNSTDKRIGYNLRDGGDVGFYVSDETRQKLSVSHKGIKLSDETKRKMSISRSGENNCNYGKPMSDETKQKLSNSLKGKKSWNKGLTMSDETRQKLSVSHKGIKLSDETKNKISKKLSKRVYQIDIDTGEIVREWGNAREAAKYLNCTHSHIISCCNGKLQKFKGYVWKYIT